MDAWTQMHGRGAHQWTQITGPSPISSSINSSPPPLPADGKDVPTTDIHVRPQKNKREKESQINGVRRTVGWLSRRVCLVSSRLDWRLSSVGLALEALQLADGVCGGYVFSVFRRRWMRWGARGANSLVPSLPRRMHEILAASSSSSAAAATALGILRPASQEYARTWSAWSCSTMVHFGGCREEIGRPACRRGVICCERLGACLRTAPHHHRTPNYCWLFLLVLMILTLQY